MQDVLTGMVSDPQMATLRCHVAECPRCAQLFNGLTETADSVSRLRNADVPAEFDERFARRMQAAQRTAPNHDPIVLRAAKRTAAAVKQFEWSWVLPVAASAIVFGGIQTHIPERIETPSSVSHANILTLLAIMLIVATIARSLIESDFSFSNIIRREEK